VVAVGGWLIGNALGCATFGHSKKSVGRIGEAWDARPGAGTTFGQALSGGSLALVVPHQALMIRTYRWLNRTSVGGRWEPLVRPYAGVVVPTATLPSHSSRSTREPPSIGGTSLGCLACTLQLLA
jgi:hypothetical protein